MKFFDAFCGIGGFHQALCSLGHNCVGASEIDKECCKIIGGDTQFFETHKF